MEKISLKFGSGEIKFRIPAENILNNITVNEPEIVKENNDILEEALGQPVESKPLSDCVEGRHVALLLEDATRDVAVENLFPAIAPHLTTAKAITAFICTGTHNPGLEGNQQIADLLKRALFDAGAPEPRLVINDSRKGDFFLCGTTQSGNPVLVNRAVEAADVFLALSDMKNHYFAGYSNAVKNFLPGICALQTTEQNHALALKDEASFGRHPWHPDASRQNNPLSQEMVEALEMITGKRPVLALATIEKNHRILWAGFGSIRPVTTAGIMEVDRLMTRKVQPADCLIVSPGGFPNDESIYTAQRSLELSKQAVKPGGKILFLAECRNGIGPESARENFCDLLAKPLPDVFRSLEERYILYSHKAYKFARLIEATSFIGVYSLLPHQELQRIHLTPVTDPVSFIESELRTNPGLTINIVNDGNKIAILN